MIWLIAVGLFLLTNLLFWLRLLPVTVSMRMAIIMLEAMRGISGIWKWFWDKIKILVMTIRFILFEDPPAGQ